MNWEANWIKPVGDYGDVCPAFVREFTFEKDIPQEAVLTVTAMGMYEAVLNGTRISDYIFAPGWTSRKRLQYQTYDIRPLLRKENTLVITVGKGWLRSPLAGWIDNSKSDPRLLLPPGLCARMSFSHGEDIETDVHWRVRESPVRFSELYDGETYDARITDAPPALEAVAVFPGPGCALVPQQGEEIRQQNRLHPAKLFQTPKGETVIDFGQNLTGYIALDLPPATEAGDAVALSFAEVLDAQGNFYTENYRGAKSKMNYICKKGSQQYTPKFTFFGFRYVRVDAFPVAPEASFFTAIALHSELERVGFFACSHPLVNRLYENVVWGQKGNFLDVPTDCPQRDERLGWTGDAQVFIKTAAYIYDVEKFFVKWLTDLSLDQEENGQVPHVIPNAMPGEGGSAAWGDAVTICPWELYLAYGEREILARQFESMRKWVDYITAHTTEENLWMGGRHFGDWLSTGETQTRPDFIASAFYARSTALVIKAGKLLGKDVAPYEALHAHIVAAFRDAFPGYHTQTEYVLALHFGLARGDCREVARALAEQIKADGNRMTTGFVGTPYLLHELSKHGHLELAYDLLLREAYPSWLYPVTRGATTIWERWDSIKPDGSFQDAGMNSFNHYAYGAVVDWLYSVAAGIQSVEAFPGYERVEIAPRPDARLGWLCAQYKTRRGWVRSKWQYTGDGIRYDIETPVPAEIVIGDATYRVEKGSYTYVVC
ncbi:MAG: glycoside hydrolase family 78 protein [Defluviitaleaceae bacterium]|nr:glycoside hydrolase family 78 protein [Defluviitaleaceae bacterium]